MFIVIMIMFCFIRYSPAAKSSSVEYNADPAVHTIRTVCIFLYCIISKLLYKPVDKAFFGKTGRKSRSAAGRTRKP